MRRNKGGGATPSITKYFHSANSNSNSCSNDTNLSAMTLSTTLTPSTSSSHSSGGPNAIVASENKIRTLLKELQTNIKKYHEEWKKSEPNLIQINKTHEKIRKEEKMSAFYRKKLRSLYATSLKEADSEIKCLRQTLDCINQVRHTQNEIRLLQQHTQRSPLSSTSPSKLNKSPNGLNNSYSIRLNLNSPPHSSVNNNNNNNNSSSDSKVVKKSSTTMRRGVLMSILQQAALTLPLWVGEIGQRAPALCGSLPPETHYLCKPGDKVAAIVKNNNAPLSPGVNGTNEEADVDEENWILAEVVQFNTHTNKYEVDDVDADEGQPERYTLGKRKVVPLPLWRANPFTDPEAIFPKDSFVLALYPQTTCFYRGLVYESPQTPLEDYLILFEDNTYPEGYSPPLNVPQLYVVADRG